MITGSDGETPPSAGGAGVGSFDPPGTGVLPGLSGLGCPGSRGREGFEDPLPEPLPELPEGFPGPLPESPLPEPELPEGAFPASDLPDVALPASDVPDVALPELPDWALPGFDLPASDLPDEPLPESDFGPDCCFEPLPDEPLPPFDEPVPGLLAGAVSAEPDPDDGVVDGADVPAEGAGVDGVEVEGAGFDAGGTDSTAGGSGVFVAAGALSTEAAVLVTGAVGAAVAAGAAAVAAWAAHLALPSPLPELQESAIATLDVVTPNAATTSSAPAMVRPVRRGFDGRERPRCLCIDSPQEPIRAPRIHWQGGSHRNPHYPGWRRKDRGAVGPSVDRSAVYCDAERCSGAVRRPPWVPDPR